MATRRRQPGALVHADVGLGPGRASFRTAGPGEGALFVSLGMSEEEVSQRPVAAECNVDLTYLRESALTESDWQPSGINHRVGLRGLTETATAARTLPSGRE